jgi:hypothetical protein
MNLARFEVGQAVIARGKVLLSHRIDIENEQGHVVGSLRFRGFALGSRQRDGEGQLGIRIMPGTT